MKPRKEYILINRGFSGEYLKIRLGHEMINFVADDIGRQWCFINKDGQLAFDKYDRINWVVNTILIRRGVFEVLNVFNVAGGHLKFYKKTPQGNIRLYDKHTEYIASQNIQFGGARFHDIFTDLSVVTFRVNKVLLPKRRIILTHEDLSGNPLGHDAFKLDMLKDSTGTKKQLGNQSARTYVSNRDQSFEMLLGLFENQDYFRKGFQLQIADVKLGHPMSFCEKDADTVDLTVYNEQKKLFLQTIESLVKD